MRHGDQVHDRENYKQIMKVAVVVTDNFSAWNFRGSLLKTMAQRGLDTYILTPSGEYDEALANLGVTQIPIKVSRLINPLLDIVFMIQLLRIFRRMRFDLVHNISIKPNIYGAMAAKLAHVPTIVGSVTGLGNVYTDEMGSRVRFLRSFITALYRFAFRLTDRAWFQNPDDIDFFVSAHIITREKAILIRSSGVDVTYFSSDRVDRHLMEKIKCELDLPDSGVVVSMVSRTLTSKGVDEFIQASALVGQRFPDVRFLLIGDGEKDNPQTLSAEYLRSRESDNYRWLGWRLDIRDILAVTDIAVLPARHREGTPKSLLEAMAMGKPIVTTAMPGCREVVDDGKNGYLVPPKDPVAFAEAVSRLVLDPDRRVSFGAYSRRKVEVEFNQEQVNARILSELYHV